MDTLVEKCMLTNEQRNLILRGIKAGKKEYQTYISLLPETITKKFPPFFLSDLVNTQIKEIIEGNSHTQMKVYLKVAGFHPYIVIHDTIRNIFILVSKLPKNRYIFNPSVYRGEFASGNVDRLMEMGLPKEKLPEGISHQLSLTLGIENQPFGIIICYDGKSDVVFEGALRPDQEDWIYKEDITDYINLDTNNLVALNNYKLSDIETPLKTTVEDNEIVIKLKNTTSS